MVMSESSTANSTKYVAAARPFNCSADDLAVTVFLIARNSSSRFADSLATTCSFYIMDGELNSNQLKYTQ